VGVDVVGVEVGVDVDVVGVEVGVDEVAEGDEDGDFEGFGFGFGVGDVVGTGLVGLVGVTGVTPCDGAPGNSADSGRCATGRDRACFTACLAGELVGEDADGDAALVCSAPKAAKD
jgi:hypothetical protein